MIVPAFTPPFATVRVMLLPAATDSVGGPTAPIINASTESDPDTVTVYVPAKSMNTLSVAAGTVPVLQLLPTFQFPPLGLIHETTPDGAVISNAVLVSGSNPVAVVMRVKPTPGRSMLRSVNCATPAVA